MYKTQVYSSTLYNPICEIDKAAGTVCSHKLAPRVHLVDDVLVGRLQVEH